MFKFKLIAGNDKARTVSKRALPQPVTKTIFLNLCRSGRNGKRTAKQVQRQKCV